LEDTLDIAVIGGGPAGLSAAINAVLRNKSVKIFTNALNYLQKAEKVDNYLGFYNISGQELMEKFVDHANKLNVSFEYGKVIDIMKYNDMFMINFNGKIINAKAVVLALGITKEKMLNNEEKLLGKGISYCATCDGALYKGKNIAVYGNADDIIEEANFLSSLGANVNFITVKKDIKGLNQNINVINGIISDIIGDNKLESVIINDKYIKLDGLFLLRNSIAPNSIVKDLILEDGYIVVNRNMETNIKGIYACGDCTGKPLQISKATGEGLVAAQNAAKYIDKLKEMI
jgi:thioredoxin reductase (NADPH)